MLFKLLYKNHAWVRHVGTDNAMLMATEALRQRPHVHYWGFDLFEGASDTFDCAYFNLRSHHASAEVNAKREAVESENPRFSFHLDRGNAENALPKNLNSQWRDPATGATVRLQSAHFADINGRRSIDTFNRTTPDYRTARQSSLTVNVSKTPMGPDPIQSRGGVISW